MVSCTYPAPFHAHTHFLATVCGILVLDAATQAPTPLCAVALLQDLHHLRLVDGVDALQGGRDKEAPGFALPWCCPARAQPITAKILPHEDRTKSSPALSSLSLGFRFGEPLSSHEPPRVTRARCPEAENFLSFTFWCVRVSALPQPLCWVLTTPALCED